MKIYEFTVISIGIKTLTNIYLKMLRTQQYNKDQRVFMVNRRSSGDTYKMINFDFKRKFPLSGRNPSTNTIYRNKKKFESEGDLQVFVFISYTIYFLSLGTKSEKRA